MPPDRDREYVHTPAESRQRGLAAIGFRFRTPDPVKLIRSDPGGPRRGTLLSGEERREDGRLLGEFEIGVFSGALLIDRDGILEQLAGQAAEHALAPPAGGRLIELGPVSFEGRLEGFRAEILLSDDGRGERPVCPHLVLLALAPFDLGVSGGLFVTLRSAAPEWPAGDRILATLQLLAPGMRAAATPSAGAEAAQRPGMPLCKFK